jgi:hypothetical protein
MQQAPVPHFHVPPGAQPLVFQPVLPTGIRNPGVYAHACRYCPSTMQSEAHLWLHEGRHWGVQHCRRCDVFFTTRAGYDNHIGTHGPPPNRPLARLQAGQPRPDWELPNGPRLAAFRPILRSGEVNVGQLAFQCQHCRSTFSRERFLTEHSGHHWGVFRCFSCDQYFASDAAYRRHRRVHHRVRRRAEVPDLEEEPFRARSEDSGIAF